MTVSRQENFIDAGKDLKCSLLHVYQNSDYCGYEGTTHGNSKAMMREISEYYNKQTEPVRSCLLGMRDIILQHDSQIIEAWKYRMPFFTYRGKMFCYLWIRKNEPVPYLGIVEGKLVNDPDLIQEKRARMKILLIDPNRDIPVRKIKRILRAAMRN